MATITPQNLDLTAGIAGQDGDTIVRDTDPLLTGDVPAAFTDEVLLLADQDLAALTVVGRNGDGKWVEADGGTTATAEGVLVYATDTTGADATAHVYRGGVFNPDLLVWNAAYSTAALRKAAFEGASSPTQIVIRSIATLVAA